MQRTIILIEIDFLGLDTFSAYILNEEIQQKTESDNDIFGVLHRVVNLYSNRWHRTDTNESAPICNSNASYPIVLLPHKSDCLYWPQ